MRWSDLDVPSSDDGLAIDDASFAVDGKLRKAKQFTDRSGVDGTPTLIVDGKYRLLGKTREDQIRILDQLVAQEQAALGAK